MKLTLSILITTIASLLASSAHSQSKLMSDPDILGIHLGMKKSAVGALLKAKYPRAEIERIKREIVIDDADLYTDMHWKVKLDKLKPSTSMDQLAISFLPDDTVLFVGRKINYNERKQHVADLMEVLNKKYGKFSYSISDDKSNFANDMMWSDTMPYGMEITSDGFAVTGNIPKAGYDHYNETPYPYCQKQLFAFSTDIYNPKELYEGLVAKSDFSRNEAAKYKQCGKMVYVQNLHDRKLTFYADQTEIFMADLSTAYDLLLKIPEMVKKNPKTLFAKVPTKPLPPPSKDTPNM